MKKTISLVLVAVMLLCSVAISPAASSAATLESGIMSIEAMYFDGSLAYNANGGHISNMYYEGVTSVKGTLEDENLLTIDGIIDESAWENAPVYTISSEYAANNAGSKDTKNVLFETPSAENTFFYYQVDDTTKQSIAPEKLQYQMRYMWDEDYLYLAVEVDDYDGHSNAGASVTAEGGNSNWDGDAFQFRVDPNGPNAIVNDENYPLDYYDPTYDSIPFVGEEGAEDTSVAVTYPWTATDTIYNNWGGEKKATLGNYVFSYSNGGYTDMADAAPRYNPHDDPNDKTPEDGIDVIYTPADISSFIAEVDENLFAYATVVPKKDDSDPDKWGTTVYEIALPWDLVAIDDTFAAVEGKELGITTVLFNTSSGKGSYNSYLEWGNGLCSGRSIHNPQTAAGSNLLTLVKETDDICAHDFAEPTCIAPYTCTICGYEKGYVSGHTYEYYDAALPTVDTEGTISATCTVCGDSYTTSIPTADEAVYYDFLTTEDKLYDQGFSSGWTMAWEILGEDGKKVDAEISPRPYLYDENGQIKYAYDNKTFGYSVADLTNWEQTGTYFDGNNTKNSYSYKMDINLTNLQAGGDDIGYTRTFGFWFGGGLSGAFIDYIAGIVEVEGDYYFSIYPSSLANIASYEQLAEKAYVIVPATERQLSLNKWHEVVFMIDDNTGTAMLCWDDEIVLAANDYHFKCPGRSDVQPIMRTFGVEFYAKDVVVGSPTQAATFINPTADRNFTLNGETSVVKAGEEITINAEFYTEDGVAYRFSKWVGDVEAAGIDASVANQTFVMPNDDVALEAEYIAIGDIVEDGMITGKDLNAMKRMVVSLMAPVDCADINGDGQVNAGDTNLLMRYMLTLWIPTK